MKIFHGELVRIKMMIRPFVIKRYLNSHNRRLLNVGAGPHKGKGDWLTADAFKAEADIYLNVYSKFPFPDNSFDVVYSEHLIEHIVVDKIAHFLQEVYRILKPGGLLRITTPDLEIHSSNYVSKNDIFFTPIIDKYKARLDKQKNKYWLIRSNGGAFMTRAVQRFYRHRFMYDYEILASCINEIGFTKSIKQSYGQSIVEEIGQQDRCDRAFETLYIDAIK
ncbi:MAG: methyltransferase domain-containing protein [Desulfovibrio sp.]|jgi:ubiquinone/menaquinone biosynthesis C-methylase UbiE|nr:methyltransferase domain-containing protein [Desulfovibrio sp.]